MHRVVLFDRVTQRPIVDHAVVVATPDSFADQVATLLKIVNDSLHRSHGDPNGVGHIALAGIRILADNDQDVGVIGEKGPRRDFRFRC